ncbi:MAG: glycosyltransferase family 4 protein [Candidatus Omnitrophica bacterium]|nr:glycosyltransferase family 4 protein [Candidatus Omnitrophota bacterium]
MANSRILYISYDGATDPLGQSQIIPYLKKLAKINVEYTLITFDKPSCRNKPIFNTIKQELSESGIKWTSLRYHKNPKVLAKLYDISMGVMVGSFLLKRNKITIIHGRSFVGAFVALILKRLFKTEFLLDYRGLWADERVDGGLWPRDGLLYKVSKYIERILLINADEVVVLTERAKKAIQDFPYLEKRNFKIEVIPTSADLKLFNFNLRSRALPEDSALNLVYVGSLGTWYMLDEMVDFFVELHKTFLKSHFLFLTPTKEHNIEETMMRNGISGGSYSIKNVYYADVPRLLANVDMSIFFIKPLFSKISSCPTKFGESLACGLPVIINSGIGDCDEIVREKKIGVVVNRFSADEYRGAISELSKLLRNKEKLSQRCRNTAEEIFSLDKAADSYQRIYNRLYTGEAKL